VRQRGRVLARGARSRLTRRGTVTLRRVRAARPGAVSLTVTARDASGATLRRSGRATLAR